MALCSSLNLPLTSSASPPAAEMAPSDSKRARTPHQRIDCGSIVSSLALKNGQVMCRHRQHDDGDTGLIDGANAAASVQTVPAAVGTLARQQVLGQAFVPFLPLRRVALMHGVRGVIVAV